jgi:hypothetical protein
LIFVLFCFFVFLFDATHSLAQLPLGRHRLPVHCLAPAVRRVSSRTRHPRDRSRHRTGLLCAIYTIIPSHHSVLANHRKR